MGSGTGIGVVDCKGLAGGLLLLLLLLVAGADGRWADKCWCCCDDFEAATSVLRGRRPAMMARPAWRISLGSSRAGWQGVARYTITTERALDAHSVD